MEWIYDRKHDNSARYTLGIVGKAPLLCFGINPSTAEPNRLDNTLKSIERIATRHGFESWVMFNVYPQRATNPDDMHAEADARLHAENLRHIETWFAGEKPIVLGAWGTLIHKRPYLKECLRDIYTLSQKHGCEWRSVGRVSKEGHPHHPLYLANTEMMKPFNMDDYMASL